MKSKSIKLLSVIMGLALAFAFIAMLPITVKQAKAASTHNVVISGEDFGEGSYAVSSSTGAEGGMQYDFKEGATVALSGKAGLALRIKNLNNAVINIKQFRFYVKGNNLVYSTYNSTFTCLWANGELTTTNHVARYAVIPANFDGWLLIPFTEMNYLRASAAGSNWVWNQNTHLSASGTGDLALPTGEIYRIGYYSLAGTCNKELVVGEHATYTETMEGYAIDEGVYADLNTLVKPGSEPLMNIDYVYGMNVTTASSENATVEAKEVYLPYGYSTTLSAEIASGYSLQKVTLKTASGASTSSRSLTVTNNLKLKAREDAVATAYATNSILIDELDSTALVMDPDKGGASGANYGGQINIQNQLATAGQDGIAIRVRNTYSTEYEINTIYLNTVGNHQWSLLNTEVTYVGLDGTVTTYCRGTGAEFKYRNTRIPANFDGYMVIPFSEIVRTRVDGTYDWTRNEAFKLVKDSEDPILAYPNTNLLGIHIYIATSFNSVGANEIILGDLYTYTGEAATFNATARSEFAQDTRCIAGNNGYLNFTAFPEAKATVKVQINGVDGVKTPEMELAGAKEEYTLGYGESIAFNPVMDTKYSFAGLEITKGEDVTIGSSTTYVNLDKAGGLGTVNFLANETTSFTLSEEAIDLTDKAGIKVSVNNTTEKTLEYSIIITDGTLNFIASNSAGLQSVSGAVKFTNVFAIPAGFAGDVYIPFNVYRGAYGTPQYAPFNYAEGAKPNSVSGKIFINCTSGHTNDELLAIFSGWEYVTELPAVTPASSENANLYVEGEADFVDGALVDVTLTDEAGNAGNASRSHAVRYSVADLAISFDVAGMAIRVKNNTGADFGIRPYFTTMANVIFVPQAANTFTLIDAEGNVTEGSHSNRNIIIPAGFDGTIVISFAKFANDVLPSGLTQNVDRSAHVLQFIDLYTAGTQGNGVLFAKDVAFIAYDGSANMISAFANAGVNPRMGEVEVAKIVAKQIALSSEEVTLSKESIIFGSNEITLYPALGKVITAVESTEFISASVNADGTWTLTVNYPYTYEGEFVVNATVAEELKVALTAGEKGVVYYNGFAVESNFAVAKDAEYVITVVPEIGYNAIVKVGDQVIEAGENNEYLIPANTDAITVEYQESFAKLTSTVEGAGSAKLNGEALVSGSANLAQAIYTLTVEVPNGYSVAVKLNGAELTAGENGYEIVLDGDKELSVVFATITYTITYDLDRGTANNPATYTVLDAITFEDATKEGYTFKGWFVMVDGEKQAITGIEAGSTGDITVFAEFEIATQSSTSVGGGEMSSCASAVGTSGLGLLAVLGLAVIIRKKSQKA